MRVTQLEIYGFRGIKHGLLSLPRHCVLLGPNDVGKSSIAEALALLAGKERLTKPICDWDFYGGAPTPASRFTIVATITDFGDGAQQVPTAFPEWFLGEKSARPVWWLDAKGEVSTEADPPEGARLAAQIALSGRYDEEESAFDTRHYFYDGPTDPFTEEYRAVPPDRLRELGIFLLPSSREWDRVLAFGSSSFLKMLREYGGVPGKTIEALKRELRRPDSRIEDAAGLKDILASAEKELRSFLMVSGSGRLIYRPTSLDVLSVLKSLVPHVAQGDDFLLPVARHGAGLVSLQTFLILLAFAAHRLKSGRHFLFIAEEPELHLHPSLHRRLVSRIRSVSTQSIVTTHSPAVASHYAPSEVIYIQNTDQGMLTAEPLRRAPIGQIPRNSVRKLYLQFRQEFYDALMGGMTFIPEGLWDYRWLTLWHRVAEASPEVAKCLQLKPLSFLPTCDAAVAESFEEVSRFRPDAVPIVDGDSPGDVYLTDLSSLQRPPRRVVRYGAGASVEYLAAWILEPALSTPGPNLARLIPDPAQHTLRGLQRALADRKKDDELHEALAWEALDTPAAVLRAGQFLQDLVLIACGDSPQDQGWKKEIRANGTEIHTAAHVSRVP